MKTGYFQTDMNQSARDGDYQTIRNMQKYSYCYDWCINVNNHPSPTAIATTKRNTQKQTSYRLSLCVSRTTGQWYKSLTMTAYGVTMPKCVMLKVPFWCPVVQSSLCNSFEERTPVMKSTGARSSNKLLWPGLKIRILGNSLNNVRQGVVPYHPAPGLTWCEVNSDGGIGVRGNVTWTRPTAARRDIHKVYLGTGTCNRGTITMTSHQRLT